MAEEIIIYGAGLIASEWYQYLSRCNSFGIVRCFAVTEMKREAGVFCGRELCSIENALEKFPHAVVHIAMQEKYHEEVINLLQSFDCVADRIIGLRQITECLKKEATKVLAELQDDDIEVLEDIFDYSTLVLRHKLTENRFKFYPMGELPVNQKDLYHIKNILRDKDFCQSLIAYNKAVGDKNLKLMIGVACSGKDAAVSKIGDAVFEQRVFAGAVLERPVQAGFFDDSGENISQYNRDYAELSVTYWLWKNNGAADYLGLCHYRRRFVLSEALLQCISQGTVDVVLTYPRISLPDIRSVFYDGQVTSLTAMDERLMLDAIRENDEDLYCFAAKFLSKQVHFPNNMVVAKREIFCKYCDWMFDILEKLRKYYESKNIVRKDRYLAYTGELLTTIFFTYHRDKYKTVYADYKLLS